VMAASVMAGSVMTRSGERSGVTRFSPDLHLICT
jgi:hypothetical protein